MGSFSGANRSIELWGKPDSRDLGGCLDSGFPWMGFLFSRIDLFDFNDHRFFSQTH